MTLGPGAFWFCVEYCFDLVLECPKPVVPVGYPFELPHPPSMLSDKINALGRLTEHPLSSFQISKLSQQRAKATAVV